MDGSRQLGGEGGEGELGDRDNHTYTSQYTICQSMSALDQGQRVETCCAEKRGINIELKSSVFA